MVVRRFALAVPLLAACAPKAAPTKPPTPQPTPAVRVAPEPAPAPAVEPAKTVRTTPAPVPEPDFEPLELSDEQLARARKLQPLVAQASKDFGVDANLINGVIWHESKFNPRARNRSGAKGLMQLMPVTARGMAKKLGRRVRPYDPEFSIQAGTKLLSIMLERFEGDEELALFAFGRGGGRVRGWQANGETQMPQGVQRFIAHVRQGQQTFEMLGFPDVL